jgi:hypothetical protein
MKHIFTLSLCFLALSLSAQETITYPYNPDGDADGLVAVPDLQDILAVYGNPFSPAEIMVGDTALSEWMQILYQALQDQAELISELQVNMSNISYWDNYSLECIEYGVASNCSPQGGFCEYISLDPNEEGRFSLTPQCYINWDPNQCVIPNWRKFRITGPNLGETENLHIHKTCDGYSGLGGNDYPSMSCIIEINVTSTSPDSFDFIVGYDIDDQDGLQISNGYGTSWTNTFYEMSVLIGDKVNLLPVLIGFN